MRTTLDLPHGRLVGAELLCNGALRAGGHEDRGGGLRCNLGHGMCWPSPMPTFGVPVGHVVGVCSQEQVIWVNASANVALVADVKALWNISMIGDPSCSMSG